jgi:sulfate permease, SulP family
VWKTGAIQATVMTVTLVLTMIIPLQQAVLVGVGISMILFIIRQSNQVRIRRLEIDGSDGRMRESDPPTFLGSNEVVVLQPYGSLFFASAKIFGEELPDVTRETKNSVVVLRLRGMSDLGSTLMEVLNRYGSELKLASSKLVIVSDQERVIEQLAITGVSKTLGRDNIYASDEWVGQTVRVAADEARDWVAANAADSS